jgi:hypothetical protein
LKPGQDDDDEDDEDANPSTDDDGMSFLPPSFPPPRSFSSLPFPISVLPCSVPFDESAD